MIIEFVKNKENTKKDDWKKHYFLFQDKKKIENVDVTRLGNEFTITSQSVDSSFKLSSLKLEKFLKAEFIKFYPYTTLDSNISLFVDIDRLNENLYKEKYICNVFIYIIPMQLHWKNIFTIGDYRNVLSDKLKNHPDFDLDFDFEYDSTPMRAIFSMFSGLPVILSFNEDFSNNSISKTLQKYIELIQGKHSETISILSSKYQKDTIHTIFTFPVQIKTVCEQYLCYFAQFLQDLGLNATSNIEEDAGKVLFSVTPTDDVEALDKIREALAVYLNLPASPIVYDDSFAAMRLQQQIENLQHSQRMAVRELQFNEKLLVVQSDAIHEKNITISQQQSVIEQQHKIIEKISSKSIMMDSVENKEELERIFDGLEVGKSEFLKKQLGIDFNPVTSLKTLGKKLIGRDDELTKLDLNE